MTGRLLHALLSRVTLASAGLSCSRDRRFHDYKVNRLFSVVSVFINSVVASWSRAKCFVVTSTHARTLPGNASSGL